MTIAPLLKQIRVSVDRPTWQASPPQELLDLEPRVVAGLGEILLVTAALTRPPIVEGFHLSDCWAFLRYAPAFADTDDLRLRPEWRLLDPHQKTILSDEIGVGLTCLVLVQALDLSEIVDTLYFLQVIDPDRFHLGRPSRIGRQKHPDYVAWRRDSSKVVVIECKGTQTHSYLQGAMRTGWTQKRSIKANPGGKIEHSLVAGAFIPHFADAALAELHLADPQPTSFLADSLRNIEPLLLRAAFRQIWLAKLLALLGQGGIANRLATTPTRELERLAPEISSTLAPHEATGLDLEVRFRSDILRADKLAYLPRRFGVRLGPERLKPLLNTKGILEFLGSQDAAADDRWTVKRDGAETVLSLPMGFVATLEIEVISSHADARRN